MIVNIKTKTRQISLLVTNTSYHTFPPHCPKFLPSICPLFFTHTMINIAHPYFPLPFLSQPTSHPPILVPHHHTTVLSVQTPVGSILLKHLSFFDFQFFSFSLIFYDKHSFILRNNFRI